MPNCCDFANRPKRVLPQFEHYWTQVWSVSGPATFEISMKDHVTFKFRERRQSWHTDKCWICYVSFAKNGPVPGWSTGQETCLRNLCCKAFAAEISQTGFQTGGLQRRFFDKKLGAHSPYKLRGQRGTGKLAAEGPRISAASIGIRQRKCFWLVFRQIYREQWIWLMHSKTFCCDDSFKPCSKIAGILWKRQP